MSKNEADKAIKISTTFLKNNNYFCGLRSGKVTWTRGGMCGESYSSVGIEVSTMDIKYLRIYYTQTDRNTGEKKDFDYKIFLTTTPCRYGGERYWFICPMSKNGKHCGRRVGTLYKSGDYFGCRHCHELTYSSRNENRRYRMFHAFNLLRIEDEIQKLKKRIKHPYYRDGPTRKQRRLEKLYEQSGTSYKQYAELERKKLI